MSPNLKYIFSALIPALGWGYWLWEEDRAVAKKCGRIGTIAFAVGCGRGLQAVLRGKEMNSTEVRLHYARWDINE